LKRNIVDELIKWNNDKTGKPILLTGAKGVGKTYLAYDFAKAFFERVLYLNFEREPSNKRFFQADDIQRVTIQLQKHFHLTDSNNVTSSTVLILDEIGYCPEALHMIKENLLLETFDYVIAISSNPISKEYENTFIRLSVYPLEFDEFLRATGNEWYIEAIINHFQSNTNIPEIVHKELLTLHDLYLRIGGMPSLVNEYLNLVDTVNVSELHSSIIGSYHDYIDRDNSEGEALKMRQVFDSLVYQLTKENKKFQYKIIRKGTTNTMYREAIQRLIELNYVIRCDRISSDELQSTSDSILNSNIFDETNTNFKLYLPDTGLLYSRIIEEMGAFEINRSRKALLENYVAQSLKVKNYPFAFWESESMAKIDFIIAKGHDFIPVEIHDSDKTRSKSISIFKQKCEFPYAIKISSKNFEFTNQIKYVPYYAVFCI
jgi:predicted AAA+ superfamily ATPase